MILKSLKLICLTTLIITSLYGCDSPQEKANNYLQSGNELLLQGDYVKAGLQFKNALQIDDSLSKAWYGLSLVEEKQGKFDKVYAILNKVVELEPDHLEAHIKLGKLYLAGKYVDKALSQSNKVMTLAPDDANVRAFRAAVLMQLSDTKGAIREANIALEKDPENVDALVVLATERLSNGDTITAIEYLDKGIAINEKNLILQLIKIKALDSLKEREQVIAVFQRLIALYPENKAFKIALAKYYIAHNQVDSAEEIFRNNVIDAPGDVEAKLDLVRFLFKEKGSKQAVSQLRRYVQENPEQYELHFALAELYLIEQQYSDAESIYTKIIANDVALADMLQAKNKLAALAFKGKNIEKARKIVNEVLDAEPENSEALVLKATISLREGNTLDAIVDLRTVSRNEPNDVKPLILLARAHIANNSIELAKNSYRQAMQIKPIDQNVVLEYANFLVRNKELNVAEDVLQSYLDKEQNSQLVLQAMAQLKLRKGQWEEAHYLVERLKEIGTEETIIQQLLGSVYRGQQHHKQSIAAFKRAHKASPSSVQPIVAVVRSYIKAGKEKEASSFLNSVLEVHPSNIYALVLLAQRNALDKNYQSAELLFKRAISTNVKNALGYLELSRFYSRQGRYEEALAIINKGLDNVTSLVSLKLAKASVLEKSGQFHEAIKHYESILVKQPNIKLAANNLASLIADHQADEKSLRHALGLIKSFENSRNPYFKDTLGWVYYRLGQVDKATPLLESAVESVPSMPIFRYHLALSLLAQGDKEKAKVELTKAISQSDTNLVGMKNAKEILQGL